MILLRQGCTCSEPIVIPKNWKNCNESALKKPWRIQYYFRDPKFKKKFPNGKLIPVKGMNHLKTLEERRVATEYLLKNEIYALKVEGYNPITKQNMPPDEMVNIDIHPHTLFCEAMDIAFTKLEVAKNTLIDVKSAKKYFLRSVVHKNFHELRICDVKRRHVRMALEHQYISNGLSANRYNKVRAYLKMLFKVLLEHDVIESDPIVGISIKKTSKSIRKTLTDAELKKIKSHLKANYYTFYRYAEIFFHSGARSTELVRVKKSDVDLNAQTFLVTVNKGKNKTQELKAINNKVMHLWEELISDAEKEDYLFSKHLRPGPVQINEWQISKRWREHVKVKLGIEADFYSLKHLHTTKVIDLYSRDLAMAANSHKSNRMNDLHYDVARKKRLLEEAKKMNIDF